LLSEAEIECEAQIDKVLGSKLEIDHLDSHMGVLQIHPEYILRFFDIAARHRLPIRMGSPRLAAYFGLPERILEVARAHGLAVEIECPALRIQYQDPIWIGRHALQGLADIGFPEWSRCPLRGARPLVG
jgi:hypothetical protein